MLFLFSILSAIALGLAFPYSALSLSPYGFVFFFALMVISGFSAGWRPASAEKKTASWTALFLGLFLCFVFIPLLQLTLAKLLVSDSHYLAGIYFGALAPVAIVAPFFARSLGADVALAHRLMILSSALFPFAAVAMLLLVPLPGLQPDLLPLAKGTLLLVALPVLGSAALNAWLPRARARLQPFLPWLNALCLAALVFILFGSAATRTNLSYASLNELARILLLGFFQDFGLLLLGLWLLPRIMEREAALALAASLSMKNTAIAATLLLFYSPSAAIPATLIFIPHALLFAILPWWGRRFLIPEAR
jgi:predicted Na+-dependent transporter